jgi:hypothetical protein
MEAEHATYHMPEDPASPMPAEGYIVAFTTFYEQGFGVRSHRFFRSLLQYYGFEQHHLTPLGILHITALVTLCQAYMGIDPYFDLWNNLFRVRLLQGSGVKVAISGDPDVYVKSEDGVDNYFHLRMSDSSDGWQKVWFFLRNGAAAPLPAFMGNHPLPQRNLGYRVAKRDLRKLQSLREVIQQLRQEGLTSMNLLQTSFSHQVQPLHQWATTMWMYSRPSSPDHAFSEELDDIETNIRIHRVLAHGADQNPGAGPPP